MDPKNLETIRDYRVINKVGEGGMGSVYLADDTMLDRKVAVKILNPLLTQDEQFTSRFRQEAKVQASLLHPNIVAMYNFFQEGENYCMVMEYAEGETLKELIRRTGPIPEERALKIFRQMLEGVGYAHSKGIIHRDIKPSNIIVDSRDNVKVMDFGIAKIMGDRGMTKTGMKMGTVLYMSPEQVRAEKDIDQRTDIYSLGITLYEMLTGRVPYNTDTDSDFEIMQEIVRGEIKDPREFYPNISELTVTVLDKMRETNKMLRNPDCRTCIEQLFNPSQQQLSSNKFNSPKSEPIINKAAADKRTEQNPRIEKIPVKKKNSMIYAIPIIALIVLIPLIIYLLRPNQPPKDVEQIYSGNSNNMSSPNNNQEIANENTKPDYSNDTANWKLNRSTVFTEDGLPVNQYVSDLLTQLESYSGDGERVTKEEFEDILNRPEASIVYASRLIRYATPQSGEIQKKEHEDYTKIFLKEKRQLAGIRFLDEKKELLDKAENNYGIMKKDLVSILMWESGLGEFTGDYQIFNIFLAQIIFLDYAQNYSVKKLLDAGESNPLQDTQKALSEGKRLEKRKKDAVTSLASFLRQCKSNGLDPVTQKGSWGGAVGYVQFMPYNFKYAIDGDNDGKINLSDWPDAILSAANFLKIIGNYNSSDDGRKKAIKKYNPSDSYVKGVMLYADTIWDRYNNKE